MEGLLILNHTFYQKKHYKTGVYEWLYSGLYTKKYF